MSELAKFSIEQRIEGMTGGLGDRSLRFEIAIDPDDMETATQAWYIHLQALFGPDQIEKIKDFALKQAK